MRWMGLESVTQSEVSQNEKNEYCIILLICRIYKNDTDELICKAEIETDVESGRMDNGVGGEGRWDESGDWD